jgi:uncharacterized membrane protein
MNTTSGQQQPLRGTEERTMDGSLRILTLGCALGAGAMGGVFFAFSTFVMRGLDRLPPAAGLAAMQQINITAVSPAFLLGLFGTAAGCVGLAVYGARNLSSGTGQLILAGSLLYLVGTIGLTIAYHVPRNDALAVLDPTAPGSAVTWATYVTEWTRANHVRTVAALAAAATFTLALARRT